MSTEIKLPRLGQGMEAGTIVKWLKAVGDRVELGEPLYELDTDKVTQEVESEAAGVLLAIAVQQGEVPVGQTIAVIGEEGEDPGAIEADEPSPAPAAKTDVSGSSRRDESVTDDLQASDEPPDEDGSRGSETDTSGGSRRHESVTEEPRAASERIKASPLARRMARERGIELAALTGTGPDRRIVAEDVERGAAAPAAEPATATPTTATPTAATPARVPAASPPIAAGEVESIPLTTIRKTIARRLTAAWDVPVFVLTVSVDMSPANSLIERTRELNPDVRVTVTDLLSKVCAQALMRHPDVNVQFTDEAILRFPSANVGIAVAAPQGLVVPVIHSAERLSLIETSQRRVDVIGRARDGELRPQDLEGGTFTISNLGMFGVEQFVAVLNPPQAAILAVGATEDRAVVKDGQIVVRPMLNVSLTVDHRAVDGAPAAEFLRTVKMFLEEPALAL